jgi:trans-aconitate 2-methyltransferase
LKPGGRLAVQMPNIVREASHAAMRLVAADGPWADRLVPIAKTRPVIASYEDYYEWLRPLCADIDVWMTTYVHRLNGPDDIVDWFAGSGLRPFLDPLDENERREFLTRYRCELEHAYPAEKDGKTFLRYPRLFLVAIRK